MHARWITGLAAALALVCVCACRRPDPGLDRQVREEIAGAWVREIRDGPSGLEGFDLRPDGSAALLGMFSLNGIAWAVSRGELVLSTNTDRWPQPNASRLQILSLQDGVLSLSAEGKDYFAGEWRRGEARRVAGVVTYLERTALPPNARVDVELRRGDALVARALILPRGPVPIPFLLSYIPEAGAGAEAWSLDARISAGNDLLFATADPLALRAPSADAAEPVELIVHPAAAP